MRSESSCASALSNSERSSAAFISNALTSTLMICLREFQSIVTARSVRQEALDAVHRAVRQRGAGVLAAACSTPRILSSPPGRSIVAIDALAAFVALLRLDRQRRDRAGFQPLDRDRLAGFLAIAVSAVLDAL